MHLTKYKDYKQFLRDQVIGARRRGFVTEMARAAGCTQSYLSQVMNGKPELTPDQALAMTEFLALDENQTEYFMNMVHASRAATVQLKRYHESKMRASKELQLQTRSAVKSTNHGELSSDQRDFYYSTWITQAVHIMTSCKAYQNAQAIAERLKVDIREVEIILQKLVEMGLVKKQTDRFIHSEKNIHLPTHSLHNKINHLNWRLRTLQTSSDPSTVHYTSAFAISIKDWDLLRAKLISFLEDQRKDISQSGAEEPYIFCCDLFGL